MISNRAQRMAGAAALWLTALGAAGADDGSGLRQLERVRAEIVQLSADRERFAREEQGLLGKLQRIEADARWLDAKREEAQLLSDQAQRDLIDAERRLEQAERALDQARIRFSSVLGVLHRAGPLGPVRAMLVAQTASDVAQGVRMAHELSRRQRAEVAALRTARRDVERGRDERVERASELEIALAQTAQAAATLQAASVERRRLLTRIHREQDAREQALTELRRASDQLQGLLEKGEQASPVTIDVTRFRGLLSPPAGKLQRGFGDRIDARFGTRLPHQGWDIELPFGAPVDAVFDGKVVFADWFRGYGLTVVLDHGHGIHTVYAHLSAITAAVGMLVGRGQALGRVGDTGSLEGVGLYFELRQKGRAVDPADWFQRPPLRGRE